MFGYALSGNLRQQKVCWGKILYKMFFSSVMVVVFISPDRFDALLNDQSEYTIKPILDQLSNNVIDTSYYLHCMLQITSKRTGPLSFSQFKLKP